MTIKEQTEMNRRDTLKAVLAAPFANKLKELLPATAPSGYGGGGGTSSNPISGGYGIAQGKVPTPIAPKISRESALARLLLDNNAIAELRSRLFAEIRPSAIDPDLLILKSLSPMAKLAHQRQREVERKLKELTNTDPNFPRQWSLTGDWLEKYIDKMMWG